MNVKPLKMLVLSLTGQCNFACRYCYASEHDKSMMTGETAIKAVKLVEKINGNEPFILQLSGGEPLLNWQCLTEVVDYIVNNKIPAKIQLQTNGSLLTDEIAKYLYKNKVGIGVSMDGRPKITDKLRLIKSTGKGASSEIIKGIEVLNRNKIGCGVTCVVTADNVKELDGIVEFAYYMGNIYTLGFDLLRGQGRGVNLKPASEEDMESALIKVYAKADQLSKLTGYKLRFTQMDKACALGDKAVSFSHCTAMTGEALFVDASGKLYGCASYVDQPEFYLGTVDTGVDQNLHAKVKERISEAMSFCRSCLDFLHCGGGCLARWYTEKGKQSYTSECMLKKINWHRKTDKN